MKKRVFIIHRWSGTAEDDWRPWLKNELLKLGYEVIVPTMPDSDEPIIDKWVSYLEKLVGEVDVPAFTPTVCQDFGLASQTYFIGHSIGCQAILRYLEKIHRPIGGAIFVAGWFDLANLEDKETEEIAAPWVKTPLDIIKVKKLIPQSVLIISDNDPFNCFEINKAKFTELGSEIVVVKEAGHFTQDDGFKELPVVLEKFKEISV